MSPATYRHDASRKVCWIGVCRTIVCVHQNVLQSTRDIQALPSGRCWQRGCESDGRAGEGEKRDGKYHDGRELGDTDLTAQGISEGLNRLLDNDIIVSSLVDIAFVACSGQIGELEGLLSGS